MTAVAPTLESWFTDRLGRQRQASPRTIASYRDTLRLLVCFMQERTGTNPSSLDWNDLDENAISAFLDHLETERHNGARTRNLRLTAIRSLFRYAALRHPEHAGVIQRVLAIPTKRFDKATVSFLSAEEAAALIDAPDLQRWEGRRDRALLVLALQTGPAGLGAHRPRLRRCGPRHRRPCSMRGQRPQTAGRASHQLRSPSAAGLDS